MGVKQNAIDLDAVRAEVQAEIESEAKKLDQGICPSCDRKGTLTRRVDPRQSGATGVVGGVWVNLRCACGYAIDRVEPPF